MSRLGSFPIQALDHSTGGVQPVQQRSMPSGKEQRRLFIGEAIERVVLDSYATHTMRFRTGAEDNRRASICVEWFNALIRPPHSWTPDRALSAMRTILDDELSGRVPPIASKSTMYSPDLTLVH